MDAEDYEEKISERFSTISEKRKAKTFQIMPLLKANLKVSCFPMKVTESK
jgi:hypothetical protein